ncbi:hypothetical protein DAPPUDRAFT_332254 [Daphnia pulex]|uniref:Uncharacterized protein n=1 Tax=Daphnia pulex TaxID=6669 RepID=E9HPF4_DAPPU|nr:hypothetical protein DAPPUDRAFT_332254 [Daphnia pulex]|eukprot:EFX66381.1 hypothetical protein DAPPUDRAFT_332254 [Daphnia pulex]
MAEHSHDAPVLDVTGKERQDPSSDAKEAEWDFRRCVYSRCFFHFVLTNGKHPFGDNGIERELNVKNMIMKFILPNGNQKLKKYKLLVL